MNNQALETIVCVDNVEYCRFSDRMTMRDLDSGELITRINGTEGVVKAKFDAITSQLEIKTRESTGSAALSRIFGGAL